MLSNTVLLQRHHWKVQKVRWAKDPIIHLFYYPVQLVCSVCCLLSPKNHFKVWLKLSSTEEGLVSAIAGNLAKSGRVSGVPGTGTLWHWWNQGGNRPQWRQQGWCVWFGVSWLDSSSCLRISVICSQSLTYFTPQGFLSVWKAGMKEAEVPR